MPKQFDPQTEIPNLTGKVIVVTGGNAGLGAETIRQLAAHEPKCIYLCARSPSKANAFIAEVQKSHPSTNIKPIQLDLSSLESTRNAAAEITKSTERIDLLFLNAGAGAMAAAVTKDGYEYHFGVNHIAHAMFAQLLMPTVLQTAQGGQDVRIITVSSDAARLFGPKSVLALQDVGTDMASYGSMSCYGHSKLANVLFAKKLAQLYPSVMSVSIHPGLVNTEIMGKMTGAGWFGWILKSISFISGQTVQEGAKTQLWAATSKDAQTGKFYAPIGKAESTGRYEDQAKIDELWEWTDKQLAAHGGRGWPTAA